MDDNSKILVLGNGRERDKLSEITARCFSGFVVDYKTTEEFNEMEEDAKSGYEIVVMGYGCFSSMLRGFAMANRTRTQIQHITVEGDGAKKFLGGFNR
tara:strand:- start:364 stop:657 length:294 start_codon:yes stop_codon:yes gene_type:complete